jgi:hypothetical protein
VDELWWAKDIGLIAIAVAITSEAIAIFLVVFTPSFFILSMKMADFIKFGVIFQTIGVFYYVF